MSFIKFSLGFGINFLSLFSARYYNINEVRNTFYLPVNGYVDIFIDYEQLQKEK